MFVLLCDAFNSITFHHEAIILTVVFFRFNSAVIGAKPTRGISLPE